MKDKSLTQWYPRYVEDYERKTAHLSLLEHGVYGVLLDFYYKTASPLPANAEQLQRICRCISKPEADALQSILDQFFTVRDGLYHHDRVDEELARRSSLSKTRKKAASARGANAPPIAPTATATLTITKASQPTVLPSAREAGQADEICEEEVLPSRWQDYAESKEIPGDQIFSSWRKFKETSSHPWKLSRWKGWIDKERVNNRAA